MKHSILLWAAVFAGPLVWFLDLEANFALAPTVCGMGSKTALHLVSIGSLAISGASGLLVASQWRRLGGQHGMAIAAIALSAVSFLTILAQSVPNVLLGGCE